MTHKQMAWLAPDCIAEPVIDAWHAWAYLLPPLQAGMMIRSRHIPVMESFVAEPELHAEALKNPELIGGPYLSCAVEDVGRVETLLEWTRAVSKPLLALADAYDRLESELRLVPGGMSLEPIYASVPDGLKGYVELVYDRSHQPHARILEAMLYRSENFDGARQSIVLERGDFDRRGFVFSTPRLSRPRQARLALPFRDKALDLLFRSRTEGQELALLMDMLGKYADSATELKSMFVSTAPTQTSDSFDGAGIRIRYCGHACILIEGRGFSILVDPLIPGAGSGPRRFSYADLPRHIDYVLLTHSHQDHVVLESLLQLRHRVGAVVVPKGGGGALLDPSLKLVLGAIGFERVIEIDDLDVIDVEGKAEIIGLPFLGEHGDLDVRTKRAYAVRSQGKCLVALADSNNLEPLVYARAAKEIGRVDALLIGMECSGAPVSWLYGPLLASPLRRRADQSRRLSGSDCERAVSLLREFDPKKVFVYAMGGESWCRFMTSVHYDDSSLPIVESNKLVAWCRERGIDALRLYGATEIEI